MVISTSVLFSLGGFLNALFAESFDDISIIPTFIMQPLIYLGGVFYSINILPDFWRSISMANPMLYVVNTFREGMLGISDVSISFSLLTDRKSSPKKIPVTPLIDKIFLEGKQIK